MLVKAPITRTVGATAQKAAFHPCLRNSAHTGDRAYRMGTATAHTLITVPEPNLRCSGGKASSSHKAWEVPAAARKIDMRKGEKPYPPRFGSVNQNTGTTIELSAVEQHKIFLEMGLLTSSVTKAYQHNEAIDADDDCYSRILEKCNQRHLAFGRWFAVFTFFAD